MGVRMRVCAACVLFVALGCLCLGNSVTELNDEMDGAELGEMSLHQGKISALTAERVRDSLRQQCIDAADAVAYRKEDIELEEAATTTGTVEEVEEKGDC